MSSEIGLPFNRRGRRPLLFKSFATHFNACEVVANRHIQSVQLSCNRFTSGMKVTVSTKVRAVVTSQKGTYDTHVLQFTLLFGIVLDW